MSNEKIKEMVEVLEVKKVWMTSMLVRGYYFRFCWSVWLSAQPAATNAEESLNLNVDGAILIDADTGKILYEQNADTALGIASMTKMMTEYLLFEAIEEGTSYMGSTISVTDYTYKISQDRRLSNVPLTCKMVAYTIQEFMKQWRFIQQMQQLLQLLKQLQVPKQNLLN